MIEAYTHWQRGWSFELLDKTRVAYGSIKDGLRPAGSAALLSLAMQFSPYSCPINRRRCLEYASAKPDRSSGCVVFALGDSTSTSGTKQELGWVSCHAQDAKRHHFGLGRFSLFAPSRTRHLGAHWYECTPPEQGTRLLQPGSLKPASLSYPIL